MLLLARRRAPRGLGAARPRRTALHGALPRPDRERARGAPLARASAVAARAHGGRRRVPRRPRRPAARDPRAHERRHRPAAQRRRGRVPARGRRRRRGPGRHACRARSRSARLDGSSAPALRAARARTPSRATHTSRCCSAPTASGSRSATAPSGSRSCAPGVPTRGPLVGWLAHSAGLLERPEPCAPGDLVDRFDPAALPREPSRVDPANCAGSLAAC